MSRIIIHLLVLATLTTAAHAQSAWRGFHPAVDTPVHPSGVRISWQSAPTELSFGVYDPRTKRFVHDRGIGRGNALVAQYAFEDGLARGIRYRLKLWTKADKAARARIAMLAGMLHTQLPKPEWVYLHTPATPAAWMLRVTDEIRARGSALVSLDVPVETPGGLVRGKTVLVWRSIVMLHEGRQQTGMFVWDPDEPDRAVDEARPDLVYDPVKKVVRTGQRFAPLLARGGMVGAGDIVNIRMAPVVSVPYEHGSWALQRTAGGVRIESPL
jgi:hypothetical protein